MAFNYHHGFCETGNERSETENREKMDRCLSRSYDLMKSANLTIPTKTERGLGAKEEANVETG